MVLTREQAIERDFQLRSRQLDRAVARFRVRHMNDTKWREVFELLGEAAPETARVRLKFVDRAEAIDSTGQFTPVSPSWCDGFPGPLQYRELQWVEVPREYRVHVGNANTPMQIRTQEIARFREALIRLGKLPIRDLDGGFRIIGYE